MRVQIWLCILLGSAALSALAFQPYEPEGYQDYAAEKVANLNTAPQGFLQQAAPGTWGPAEDGKRQTDFQVFRSRAPKEAAWYLDRVFALTDAAAVEWRAAVSALSEGREPYLMEQNYATILQRLKALETPESLLPFEAMVAEAIDAQRRYLLDWQEDGDSDYLDWDDDLLELSEARLAAAYAFLMERYPDEDRHNQRAIRDHLIGPDFFS